MESLLDKLDFLTDLLDLSVFPLVIFDFLFFKVITSLGIDGNDQGTELFDPAVPESLGHAQISPFGSFDLFNGDSCHDRVARGNNDMDTSEVLAGCRCLLFHATLAYDDADARSLDEFIFKFLHTHGCCRTNGDHLKFVVLQWTDDGTRVKDGIIPDIYGNLSSLFDNAAVSNIAAGREAARQIQDIANLNISKIFSRDRCYQDLFSVLLFNHYNSTPVCVVIS